MFKKILCLLVVLATAISYGQLSDLARVEFTIIPPTNSDFEFTRTRVLFNYPIKLDEKQSYLFLGLDYRDINVVFGKEEQPFEKEDLDGFRLLDLNIGYTFKLKNDWRLGARFTPGISSNLSADELSFDDVVFSADLVFIKDKKKDDTNKKHYRIIFGVSYSQNRGFPFPLPFISYYRKFNEKWSYNLGIPKSNLQYHYSEKSRLKLYAQLDGFTANIQQEIPIDDDVADRFNMSLIVSGLQYEFHFKKRFEFYLRGAYILNRGVNLRNTSNDDLFEIDDSNGLSLQAGFKIKI